MGTQFLHVRSQLDVVTLVRLLVVGPFVEQVALPVQVRHLSQQALIFNVHRFGHKSPETQNPWCVSQCTRLRGSGGAAQETAAPVSD